MTNWSDSRGGPPRGKGLEDVMYNKKLGALELFSWRQEGKVSVSKSNYSFPYLKWVMEKKNRATLFSLMNNEETATTVTHGSKGKSRWT